MQPILWQSGNLTIGSYAALMSLGLLAAVGVIALEARRRHLRSAFWLDAVLAAVTIGVISARLGYAAVNWAYFQDHPGEVWQIWQGGLNWQAGLVGGSIGAWLIAHRSVGAAPAAVLDVLAIGAPLGLAFGWAGCHLSACAYGRELFPGEPFFFLNSDAPDLYGAINPRWPSQWLGVVWSAAVFLGLWLTRSRAWPDGARFWLFITAYSAGAWLIGFTRGDDVPRLAGWRLDQWFDLALGLIGAIGLAISRRHRSPLTTPSLEDKL